MPVILDAPASPARGSYDVVIGLLNNLGKSGLENGERQLVELLEQGCGGRRVRLRLFALPSVPRGDDALRQMSGRYHGLDALLGGRIDGLFVTGAEPRCTVLRDEAFWPDLAKVIDWAKTGTRSTIWSCLAAHAAVLHLDGIERQAMATKCTGVFDVTSVGDHPLLVGVGERLQVCHSRWNDVDEAALVAAGYTILTRSCVGVDAFVRRCGAEFVCLQGHPEYDRDALGREARRDLTRWRSDPARRPSLPSNYFYPCDERRLRAHVAAGDVAADLPEVGTPMAWNRDFAVALMRNWLTLLVPSAARAA